MESVHGDEETHRGAGSFHGEDRPDSNSNNNNDNDNTNDGTDADADADAQRTEETPHSPTYLAVPTSPTSPTELPSPTSPTSPAGAADDFAYDTTEWTPLDDELLEAAVHTPGDVPGLIEKGANVAVTSTSGHSFLHILINKGLENRNTATVVRVLPGVLDHMDKIHIDGKPKLIDALNKKQMTPVICAIFADPQDEFLVPRYEIIELLLQHHAEINIKDKDGCTALDWASRRGYSRIAELLLQNGADPNVQDKSDWSPLQTASRYGHYEVAKLLLAQGARVNVPDDTGWTAIKMAARYGWDSIVDMLLLVDDVEVDYVDNDGWTPLEEAVYGRHEYIVSTLLEHGANANKADKEGSTILNGSCRGGYEEIVRLLLAHGADPNISEKDGWTPLMAACRNDYKNIAEMLLNKGAKIDAVDKDGWPALEVASRYGHTEVALLLLNRGASVSLVDSEGWSTLEVAARYGFDEIVRALLQRGANPNTKDDKGWTPLILASKWGCEAIVEMLIKAGADINAVNATALGSIHSAAYNGHRTIAEILLKAGADMTKGDDDGETPIHLASRQGYASIVDLLLRHRRPNGVNALDNDDETALHVTSRSDDSYVDLLINDAARDEDVDRFCATKTGDDAPGQFLRVMKLLLQHGADPNLVTGKNQTALHMAAMSNDADRTRLILSKMNKDAVGIRNIDGRTAMGIASFSRFADSLRELLLHLRAVDWGIADVERETLLWLAESSTTHDIIALILLYSKRQPVKGLPVDKSWDALTLAAYYGEYELVKYILQSAAPHPGDNKRRKTVENLVRRVIRLYDNNDNAQMKKNVEERHGSLRAVPHIKGLEAGSMTEKAGAAPSYQSERLSHQEADEGRADVASAHSAPRSLHDAAEDEDKDNNAALTREDSVGAKADSKTKGGKPKVSTARPREDYESVLDILLDPPIVKTSGARVPYALPETKVNFPRFDACVIDFYAQDGRSGFLRRFRDVKDVIYEDGPKEIMNKARRTMQTAGETYEEGDLTLRWIHLPANNLQWMNDLALRMFFDDGESQEAYEDLRALLRGSWHEVPDASFDSKFMKPSCSMRLGAKWKNKAKSLTSHAAPAAAEKPKNEAGYLPEAVAFDGLSGESPYVDEGAERTKRAAEAARKAAEEAAAEAHRVAAEAAEKRKQAEDNKSQIALYMPYITFSLQQEHEADERPEYHQLLRSYEEANVVIHGSRTLDEFYYHFERDEKSEAERQRRNKDQVVTAELNDGVAAGASKSWTILRVDQLWLWVLNEKYIITSSTHRMDEADDIVPSTVLNYLSKDPGSERARPQPDSAVAMSKFVVDFCIGFFGHLQADAGPMIKKPEGRRSTRQIFSDAINRASIKEAELFRQFTERSGRNKSDPKRLKSIREAADLLRNVKDIRDELNILRLIVSHQKMVQESLPLPVGATHNDRHARSVVVDIEELDKMAKKIEGAVNATLSLEQSAIAIAQSDETVQQGQTLMTFTIITILFLPISFLTSLFALNIESFQRRESDGDLSYTSGWIFPKLFGISFAVWVPTILWAFYLNDVRKLVAGLRRRFKSEPDNKPAPTPGSSQGKGLKDKATLDGGASVPMQKDGRRKKVHSWAVTKKPVVDVEAGEVSEQDSATDLDKDGHKGVSVGGQ